MSTNLELFLYTMDEYIRFANHLPLKKDADFLDKYSESDYIGIQVRLMLLRKYYGSSDKENVNFKRLIKDSQEIFPEKCDEFQLLLDEFVAIESQQIEHLLSDGTKLNLYATIEDAVYGLYLHADELRIQRLNNTAESIRVVCVRKYILDIESLVMKLYQLLRNCGLIYRTKVTFNRAPVLYLGDTSQNSQSISSSPYWSNLYGSNLTDGDLFEIITDSSAEDIEIIRTCIEFTNELEKPEIDVKKLQSLIYPATKKDWDDFSEIKRVYTSIEKPGFSTKVRYNKNRDTAYVILLPKVDDAFKITSPHLSSDIYEISLGKWNNEWKIFSFGGHLDSIYIEK